MKVPTLKPGLSTANLQRLQLAPVPSLPDMTPRLRGSSWMRRRAAHLYAHPLCAECERLGLVTAADEVDHDRPLWAGGLDTESNYRSLCRAHHAEKTAGEAAERARRIRGID